MPIGASKTPKLNTKEPARPDAAIRLQPAYLDLDELIDDLGHEVAYKEGRLFGPSSLNVRAIDPARRKIALAVSGGGAAGAYSAGALETLLTRLGAKQARPDIILGTSAGALNGYGVLIEALGKDNPQLTQDPDVRQPYTTFIASMWSYLDRNERTSSWVVGRRAWMIDLAAKGFNRGWKPWGLALALILSVFLFNPFLFVALFLYFDLEWMLPVFIRDWTQADGHPAGQLAFLGLCSVAGLAFVLALLYRSFGRSLFLDTPLLRLLANTGPKGDLTRPWRWPRGKTLDRARVLSREIVSEWYRNIDTAPEFIVSATNITVGRECLFTLVRPDTYEQLVKSGWMAVQLDSQDEASKPYHEIEGAVLTLAENLIECIVASTAVPSAFPAQEIDIYGPDSRRSVRHRFVDGGVLNNSPIHLAIDAGASHIVSLELDPLEVTHPLEVDDRGTGYNVLQAGVTTFTTLLDRANERDIRRTVTWNRFLVQHPESLVERPSRKLVEGETAAHRDPKRIIPLYRIAPLEREIGTAEFDGRFVDGRQVASLRDVLRRGMLDLRGRNIWRATLQSIPNPDGGCTPK